jgi:hypothetical protein
LIRGGSQVQGEMASSEAKAESTKRTMEGAINRMEEQSNQHRYTFLRVFFILGYSRGQAG